MFHYIHANHQVVCTGIYILRQVVDYKLDILCADRLKELVAVGHLLLFYIHCKNIPVRIPAMQPVRVLTKSRSCVQNVCIDRCRFDPSAQFLMHVPGTKQKQIQHTTLFFKTPTSP